MYTGNYATLTTYQAELEVLAMRSTSLPSR